MFGTANVVAAARTHGVGRFVYASTGKAMHPFTSQTYAASKKIGEWIVATAGQPTFRTAATRFTHVVDNSLLARRLRTWTKRGDPVRLHGTDIAFYVQSATESARLLIAAASSGQSPATPVYAICDLGMPVKLLDLVVGALNVSGSDLPLLVQGFEAGYDEHPFPALFDPRTAVETSPLFSAFEAESAERCLASPDVDAFPLAFASNPSLALLLADLRHACADGSSVRRVHGLRDRLCWTLLAARLAVVSVDARRRTLDRLAVNDDPLLSEHFRVAQVLRESLENSSRLGPDSPG